MREYTKQPEQRKKAHDYYMASPQRAYIVEQRALGCEVCGEMDPRCIQFHHRDPKEKLFTIGGGNHTMKAVVDEMEKCARLCANCHCKVHLAYQ